MVKWVLTVVLMCLAQTYAQDYCGICSSHTMCVYPVSSSTSIRRIHLIIIIIIIIVIIIIIIIIIMCVVREYLYLHLQAVGSVQYRIWQGAELIRG